MLIRVVLSIVKSLWRFAVTDGELLARINIIGAAGLLVVDVLLLVHQKRLLPIITILIGQLLIVWLCHESAQLWLFTHCLRHDTHADDLRLS